jgi:sulfotransferase
MEFIALSGLPRSGSTLLSSILDQNPDIHAEGNSAVCQLMWDMQVSCETNSSEQLLANNRNKTQNDIISSIPKIYYKDVKSSYIVDKCRSWTLPANVEIIKRYIRNDPKVIVLTRPVDQIVKSFVQLRKRNGWSGDLESDLLIEGSEPIMRSLDGVNWAKENNNGEFLFIEYDDLVDYTEEVLISIYNFCGFEPFQHDLNNIINNHPENDKVYNLIGMHDIRSTISKI